MPFGPFGPFGMQFDLPEFIVGLVSGVVLVWFVTRFRPIANWLLEVTQELTSRARETFTAGAQDRYKVELIERAETLHATRSFFALQEVVIPPRILAPSPPTDPESEEAHDAGALSVLPNLPDTTYLSAVYGAPSLLLTTAVRQGHDMLLSGPLGSGKTTALCYLALAATRGRFKHESGDPYFPILVHAAELMVDPVDPEPPLDDLVAAVQSSASAGLKPRLPGYLRQNLSEAKGLVLVDGLDELTEEEIQPVADWLRRLRSEHPTVQIVAAGPVRAYDGLVKAGLAPVTIAPWTDIDQRHYLNRWGSAWKEHVAPHLNRSQLEEIDPSLITGWLAGTSRGLTPLELTLRAWAAYAGDVRGPSILDGYRAFLRRFLSHEEQQMAASVAVSWIEQRQGAFAEPELPRGSPVASLIEADILVRRPGRRLSFLQPAIGAYLAAEGMLDLGVPETVDRGRWSPARAAHSFYVAQGQGQEEAEHYLQADEGPLQLNTLRVGRWLRIARPKAPWRPAALRALGKTIQNAKKPYGLRLRFTHTMAEAKEPTAAVFFRRMLSSERPSSRILAALGLGGVRDLDSVPELRKLIDRDRDMRVRQACCLALAALGSEGALEALGELLLQGEEGVRVAAAEALAIHGGEGHQMLQDGVEVDEVMTRRAAVFGLVRVPEKWATETLRSVQMEDPEWVVRGAAAEALEKKTDPPYQVHPPPDELSDLPWLVAFAAREGLGVGPGRPALEMIRRALNEGTPDEQVAALETLAWTEVGEFDLELRRSLTEGEPYLRDAAYEALWRQTAGSVSERPETAKAEGAD